MSEQIHHLDDVSHHYGGAEHHWTGLTPNPEKYFGFTYIISHKWKALSYVGKRQYWRSSGKRRGPIANTLSDKWRWEHWKPNKWEYYAGSSKHLKAAIKEDGPDAFEYIMTGQYTCKADLVYGEAYQQMARGVLTQKNEDGTRTYLNGQIGAIKFIPPLQEREELY